MPEEPVYPRYPNIRGPFEEHLKGIDAYCTDATGRPLCATQCELTYVNHITGSDVWTQVGEVDRVTELWGRPEGFLPTPEHVQFSVAYVMKARDESTPIGRLHVAMVPDVDSDTGEERLSLTLTARGEPAAGTIEGAMAFLDRGHDWIVQGFKSIATSAMLAVWKEL
jgi:hypothetical protein